VAKLTHDISIFTEGILMMKTTLVGIIKVEAVMQGPPLAGWEPFQDMGCGTVQQGMTDPLCCSRWTPSSSWRTASGRSW